MRIESTMNIDEYLEVVREIVDGYFDDGEYIPQVGTIAAMEAFFNHCVKESDYNSDGDEREILDIVCSDDTFIEAYNAAIANSSKKSLNFGNAYRDAMMIVEDKKSSYVRIATLIADAIKNYFSPDNIASIFGESDRFKEIINSDNIVSFKEMTKKK